MKDGMFAGKMAVALLCSAGLGLAGCTSQMSSSLGSAISANAAKTTTQMVVTDAPADQVLALSLDVDSIVLTDASGATTTVLSTPTKVEASHLDAVQEPLLPPVKVPQDTYVSATITVANPVVVYCDPATKQVVKTAATLTAATTTVTFNAPIVVGTNAAPIVFDIMVGQSVSITGSGTSAVVDVTPVFDVRQITLNGSPTNGNNGKINGVVGMITAIGTNSLTVETPSGVVQTIAVDSNTVYQGVSGLSALQTGEIVDVDVAQQANGTLLATRVHLFAQSTQDVFVGPVTAKTGTPVTSFTQLVRQPIGPGATPSATAASYTVSVGSSTTFAIAPQVGTLPALPFATAFTASTMFAGQNVATVASSFSGTNVTAASVTLLPQTVGGTVAAIGTSAGFTTYTVTLPSGSALGTLTGAASVVVYVGSNAQQMQSGQLTVGSQARFNGLLFSNGGTLVMFAGECHDGPGQPPKQKH